uniref:Uncharacterized protein n=1 Tax=Anguilla anguilla TaxID=7936 RepID=A0A0E9WRV6_ANGAN
MQRDLHISTKLWQLSAVFCINKAVLLAPLADKGDVYQTDDFKGPFQNSASYHQSIGIWSPDLLHFSDQSRSGLTAL